jgi:acyl-CoA thioester hydrolase
MKIRVYYHHTDCGGVVYYGNYLKFLEEGRTDFMESRGLSVKKLMDEDTMFVVYRQEIDYKYPGFYGDVLNVESKVTKVEGVRIEFEYEIKNQDGRLLTKAKTVMVCVNKHLEPKIVSPQIKESLLKTV